ncbi:MAG: hypothetical protein U9O87_10975 [Verrucomicrobiota bacterium]|nr:hypothetical protein [Verrucomicrobiota bacterium]
MRIANPIYDAVFKYLLTEDLRVAKIVISKLINKKVIDLQLNPTELIAEKKTPPFGSKESYTVMRMDFSATIEKEDKSEEIIIVELQKAKLISDVMRFRRYLGSTYMKREHRYRINGKIIARPIYPIYILGHNLDGFNEEAIQIKRALFNALTNQKLNKKSHFIDGLTHDGLVIQIPSVTERIKQEEKDNKHPIINSELKKLLTIFDQSNYIDDDHHYIDIEDKNAPHWLKKIIRTLEKAALEKEVRNRMILEDDYIADLEDMERQIEEANKQAKKDRIETEKEKKRAEKADRRAKKADRRAEKAIQELAELKANLKK